MQQAWPFCRDGAGVESWGRLWGAGHWLKPPRPCSAGPSLPPEGCSGWGGMGVLLHSPPHCPPTPQKHRGRGSSLV